MPEPEDDPFQPPRAPLGLDPGEPAGTDVPPGSPWSTIWVDPRGTIRGIVETDPTYAVLPLAMLAGFASALANLSQRVPDEFLSHPPGTFLGAAAVAGAALGLMNLYLQGALIRWTGGWLGGVATAREVRAAVAWSSVPNVACLPLILILMAALGPNYFRIGGVESAPPRLGGVLLGCGSTMLALSFWGAYTYVKCVAEVHRFSAWLGLVAIFLGVLLMFTVALAIACLALAVMVALKIGG